MSDEVEYVKCDICGVDLIHGGWGCMYGFWCHDCGKGLWKMNPKSKRDARMRQIEHIVPNATQSGSGARIICEQCNHGFECVFSHGTHEQAYNATIAASKAYGWKVSKKAVVCNKCQAGESAL